MRTKVRKGLCSNAAAFPHLRTFVRLAKCEQKFSSVKLGEAKAPTWILAGVAWQRTETETTVSSPVLATGGQPC
jgi:hypothetical protein